jgi:hypothetical protein
MAPVPSQRHLYMVLSPHALGYARLALSSLLTQSDEPLNLHLITDSCADKQTLLEALAELAPPSQHTFSVASEEELADAEASIFANHPSLRAFRHGHPCWRKITDPLLLGAPGEELILLDPDLYFPNRFRFEPTPATGLLLMWQTPNCLLPPDVVRAAFTAKVALARHVDIGVAHWRSGVDLAWLDWLIAQLGGSSLPRMMHVEAIVWAAIAMRQGGGYLDPSLWVCWRRSQSKRIRRKLGADGRSILRSESWPRMKCFHAGGEAKWWLPEAQAANELHGDASLLAPGRVRPFVELTRARYEREQTAKSLIRNLGYYRLFGGSNP